jgi:probable F420-dependent oxidoreductase
VRINVEMPLRDGASEPEVQLTLAEAFENAGFGALTLTDHPSPSLKWLRAGGHPTFDPFAGLAFYAAVTSRIRLMTHLAVLPYRNPLLLAKSIATVDRLSGGRFTLIAGTGYLRSEFFALGRSFEDRNALFDEALAVLAGAFSPDGFSYEGRDFTAVGQIVDPPPVQLPCPPIWIGGNSARSRQRVATSGDGWSPVLTADVSASVTRTAELRNLDELARAIDDLRDRLAKAARDPAAIAIQIGGTLSIAEGVRHPAEHLEQIARLAEIGVTDALVGAPDHRQLGAAREQIAEYGEKVVRAR